MANQASSAPLNPEDGDLPLLVHVTAPSSLPAGYTFEAEINGDSEKVFTCEVPDGGVTEGQIFLTPLPPTYAGERLKAPTGHWKDGLFSFCDAGFFHPSLWCSCICPQIAMAQIISRMQLTWLGEPGSLYRTSKAFSVIVVLVVSYMFYSFALELAAMPYAEGEIPTLIPGLKFLGIILFSVYSLYSLCRTRENVRARYQIPETYCIGCEDICCSMFCSCCATAQMLRHTGEYETHPGTCFTKTGHPAGTPLVV